MSCDSKLGEVSADTEHRGSRYIDSYAVVGDPGKKFGMTTGYEGAGCALKAVFGAISSKAGD